MPIVAETNRLIIRTWVPEEDAKQALEIYSDPEVTRFLITKADTTESMVNILQRWATISAQLNNGTGLWAIVLKTTQEIVGTIVLIQLRDKDGQFTEGYEIGWHLKKAAWGNGYATEAAKVILDYGFNSLKLPVNCSIVNAENTASIRVIQRLGMTPVGRTNQYYIQHGTRNV